MELNPFNHLAFGPSPNCLRLKTKVTFSPPRLATSEWLVLTRRESHPLYDTTYARPHTCSLMESNISKDEFRAFLELKRMEKENKEKGQ